MTIIAPSLLSADFSRLQEEIKDITCSGVEWLHLDIMDGHFVPNLTFGPAVVAAIRPYSSLVFDAHLMISRPEDFITPFARAGADYITVHVEACTHLHRILQQIREAGCRAGVALNPATSLNKLDYVLDSVDLILLMTVNPGFGGQDFIPEMLPKIAALRSRLDREKRNILLAVDGGINSDTAYDVCRVGADVLVVGSAIFNKPNRQEAIAEIIKAVETAVAS